MNEDNLGNGPEENLRMENELLRLKMLAELGGKSHSSEDLPPEIENEFLKHIFQFEKNFANAKRITVHEKLGKPDFKKRPNGVTILLRLL